MDELYGLPGHQEQPDLDDLDYMGDPTAPLQAKAEGGVEQELLLDNDLVRRVLEAIHGGRAEEIDPGLFRAVLELLGEAADDGERRSSVAPGEEFRQRVDYNNAVFAAFKVHRFQGDLVRQLTDSNGVLKPFNQWLNDVQGIVSHHCGTWLRTEYDTAVIRMQQASDWQRFERDKDIMPCLEWMPSTSLHPGADHKVFWGTVRPVDDPFWTSHRPGDRWNCKCWLQNTDKAPTPLPEGMEEKENRPAPGLDNNPGRDAKLFADSHPYIAEAYPGAEEAVGKLMADEFGGKESEYIRKLEESIGVKKGEPMSFEEADGMKGNPHHKEDVMYRVNCQSCVVANELRRRGFDVEAFGNPDKEGYASSALALDVFAAWTDKDGQRVQPVRVRRGVKYRDIDRRGNVHTTYESDKELQARILDTMKEPGRYIVRWSWDKKTTGHVITAERTEDGAFRFYDPQSGKTGFNWQMKQVDTAGRGFSILKIDGLYPNTAIVSEVVKKAGSDRQPKMMTEAARKEFERLGVLDKKESTMASELTLTKNSVRKSDRFQTAGEQNLPNLMTGNVRKNYLSRKNVINHCFSEEEINAAEYAWNHPSKLRYIGYEVLGARKDLSNPADARNVEKKKRRKVVGYTTYVFDYDGREWAIKLEVIGGSERFYSIIKRQNP